jgi:membrane protease YdiL (CAAX protease family)
MTRRELPDFLKVPWGIKDALLLVFIWLALQVLLGIVLAAVGEFVPAVNAFISEGDIANTFILYAVQVALGLGLAWLFARHYKVGWQALGWRRVSLAKAIGYMAAIFILFILLVQAALLIVQYLVPGFDPNEAQTNDFTQNAASNRSLAIIALVLLPPIFEETIFRGFIFPAFSKRMGVIWGAVLSSAIFGIAHGQANLFVYTLLLGLLLCFLYMKTRSIITGIIVHMINNLIAFWAMAQK